MKRILTILSIVIISLISCGCTHGKTDLCTSFKEIPYDYNKMEYTKPVSNEYLEKDYEYMVKCKIEPALEQNNFNSELGLTLTKFARIANLFPIDKRYDILRENLEYHLWYELGSIPQNTDKYNSLWQETNYIKDIAEVGDNLGCDWDDIQNIIFHLVQVFEQKGYFNDYKVADMFLKSLDIIGTTFENHSMMEFEPEFKRIAKYNENKPNARYTLKFLGSLLYMDENYYYKN